MIKQTHKKTSINTLRSKQGKRQHYVPIFYLKFFSSDGKTIYMYNIKDDICKRVAFKDICVEKYFYPDPSFEPLFSQLEGSSSFFLGRIIDEESLNGFSQMELIELYFQILFQYGRTKSIKDFSIEFSNTLFDIYKESSREDPKVIRTEPEWAFLHSLLVTLLSGIFLYDLNIILLSNKSKIDFIFSDNPVILFNSFFNKREEVSTNGICTKGLQVIYPITSELMIFMYDPNFYELNNTRSGNKIKIQKNKDIQRLNGLQIINASENVFFKDDSISSKIRGRYYELKDKIPERRVDILFFDSTKFYMAPSKYYYNLEKLSFLEHKKTDENIGLRDPKLKEHVDKIFDDIIEGKIKSLEDILHLLSNKTLFKH